MSTLNFLYKGQILKEFVQSLFEFFALGVKSTRWKAETINNSKTEVLFGVATPLPSIIDLFYQGQKNTKYDLISCIFRAGLL